MANATVAPTEHKKPTVNNNVSKRLYKELRTLMMSGSPGISAFPRENNILQWIGTIEGAEGTLYEGLKYQLILSFPPGYPLEAMHVKFETPCFHPNVDTHGNICLDILKEKWAATYDTRTVLLSIQSLLADPNNDSPLNSHAAGLWNNQEAYRKVLLEHYRTHVDEKNKQTSGKSNKQL